MTLNVDLAEFFVILSVAKYLAQEIFRLFQKAQNDKVMINSTLFKKVPKQKPTQTQIHKKFTNFSQIPLKIHKFSLKFTKKF